MERRRDERISVSLKAALLTDDTLPKGCRVRDFSQRGMLLQYEYDGNATRFDEGDSVTVRLSLRQQDERKVVTLPATVRRVEQNGIGVEFLQPQEHLLALLESFRLDQPAAMEALRVGAGNGDSGGTVAPLIAARVRPRVRGSRPPLRAPARAEGQESGTAPASAARRAAEFVAPVLGERRLFYTGLVSLLCAVLIVIIDFADNAGLKSRLSTLEADSRKHSAALSGMGNRLSSLDEPGQELADLNARVETLAVSLASLEGRLAPVARRESIDVAVMEKAVSEVGGASAPVQTPAAPVAKTGAAAAAVGEVEAALDGPAAGGDAPWVINLVSLYDKAAADQFVSRAQSKGVRVEQNKVAVKGRDVWRLQISGFATQQQARDFADGATEKLGLKEVWVFKR